MVYADTDFWVALMKQDDWLKEKAEALMEEYSELEISLTTVIELSLILKRYEVDRRSAIAEVLEISDSEVSRRVVFQALEYIDDGLNTFDSFHAAHAGDKIISSDKEFEKIEIDRIKLEEQ